MKTVPLQDIVRALDEELRLAAFAGDPSNNGLQVDGAPDGVSRAVCGVDATPDLFAEAARRGAQLCFVHHGISWGSSLARIAGPNYRLVAPLVRSGIALYAAHLPLDAHPVLGNNAGLARAIGLEGLEPFAEWRGFTIGVKGRFPEAIPREELHRRVREACPGGRFETVDAGAELVRTAGVVSGESCSTLLPSAKRLTGTLRSVSNTSCPASNSRRFCCRTGERSSTKRTESGWRWSV